MRHYGSVKIGAMVARLSGWLRMGEGDFRRFALIMGVALAVRVAWVVMFQTPPGSDAAAYDELGWRLAQGQGYIWGDGTPTAFWPVGYPAFLAAIYLIFGYSWLAAGMANALLGAVNVALTYRLAREALSVRVSLAAAGVVALLPSHIISFTSVLRNESLHTALTLAALIAVCRLARRPTWANAALFGLVLGVGLYVRPILLVFPVVAAALIAIRGEAGIRKAVGLAGLAAVVALLVISPWTIRNYFVMDGFVLTATNGGITFYLANGPGATGEFRAVPAGTFSDPSEMTIYREGVRKALGHMVSHPEQWVALLPVKFFHLWASDRYSIAPSIIPEAYRGMVPVLWVVAQVYWTLIVIGAVGAAVSRPIMGYWLRFPAVLFPLTLLYWNFFHLMFHGEGRFHIQMIPIVVIVAGHLFEEGRDWRAWLPGRWRGQTGGADV